MRFHIIMYIYYSVRDNVSVIIVKMEHCHTMYKNICDRIWTKGAGLFEMFYKNEYEFFRKMSQR